MALPWIPNPATTSADVSAGQDATAAQYNNLRTDALNYLNPPLARFVIYITPAAGNNIRNNTINAIYTDNRDYFAYVGSVTLTNLIVIDTRSGGDLEIRDVTSDFAAANMIQGIVKIGSYIYVCVCDTTDTDVKIFRFTANDIAAGGTEMTVTIGNITSDTAMRSDGTYLYINNNGANTASNQHVFEKFSISGTTLNSEGVITCGSTNTDFTSGLIDGAGNFYGMNATEIIRRFNSAGTLQQTASAAVISGASMLLCVEGVPYTHNAYDNVLFFQRVAVLA